MYCNHPSHSAAIALCERTPSRCLAVSFARLVCNVEHAACVPWRRLYAKGASANAWKGAASARKGAAGARKGTASTRKGAASARKGAASARKGTASA